MIYCTSETSNILKSAVHSKQFHDPLFHNWAKTSKTWATEKNNEKIHPSFLSKGGRMSHDHIIRASLESLMQYLSFYVFYWRRFILNSTYFKTLSSSVSVPLIDHKLVSHLNISFLVPELIDACIDSSTISFRMSCFGEYYLPIPVESHICVLYFVIWSLF